MSKVSIELDCQKYLQLVIEDDHRTTISLKHGDGLELLGQLKAYYEDGELRQDIIKHAAVALLQGMIEEGAERTLIDKLLKQTGKEIQPDGHDPK